MTPDEARAAVEHIRAVSGDSEVAHSEEDELHVQFIRHVAEHGPDELRAVARIILETEEMGFSRWTA